MGKGEAMAKKKRKSKKLHLSEASQLLVRLEKVVKAGVPDSSPAISLVHWFMDNQSWTEKQWSYAKAICYRFEKTKKNPIKNKKYYLYAITDGESVKLGYSSNIRARIKNMQTGCPNDLKCIWKYYVGRSESEANKTERRLHRYCKSHRKRGEWFSMYCMVIVEQFTIKEKMKANENQEDTDREILTEALQRI